MSPSSAGQKKLSRKGEVVRLIALYLSPAGFLPPAQSPTLLAQGWPSLLWDKHC